VIAASFSHYAAHSVWRTILNTGRRTIIPVCWALWQERQCRAGEDSIPERAKLAIRTHLARIERSRPLDQISNLEQRVQAQSLRDWFVRKFLA
jgi:hypothetical protein